MKRTAVTLTAATVLVLSLAGTAQAHRAHRARDPLAYCRKVATATTPGAQTLTVVNDNSVNAGWLLRNECAVVTQARALRRYWGTPLIRFGSGGWPIYLVRYGQEITLGLPPIPTGSAGYHAVQHPACTWLQGCPPPVPYAVIGDPAVGGLMMLSHEVMEMLADPYQSRYVNGRLVEVCDPVQFIDSQANDGAMLSDFVTPAYFQPGSTGPWDVMGALPGPITART